MLLAEHFKLPSTLAFLVGKGKVLHQIKVDAEAKEAVLTIRDNIKAMLDKGLKPDSSASINQCCHCEYLNYCNDRL